MIPKILNIVKIDRVKEQNEKEKRKKFFNGKVSRVSEIVNIVNPPSLSVNIEYSVNNFSSFHKVEALFSSTPQKYAHINNKDVTGYKIIDCSILSDVVSVLCCRTCFQTA